MARKKLDPEERARRKRARAEERKRLRKLGKSATSSRATKVKKEEVLFPNKVVHWAEKIPQNPKDLGWLITTGVRAAANKIFNDARTRPYYVSVHWPEGSGPEPCFDFYPCGYFRSGDRVYYSFAFVEHRNAVFDTFRKELRARKETLASVIEAHENK